MKTLLSILALVTVTFCTLTASAQPAGRHWVMQPEQGIVLTAATNTFTPGTTNQVFAIVAECDNPGLTWYLSPNSTATNGTVILRYKFSYDGGNTVEAGLGRSLTVTSTGAAVLLTPYATNLVALGATHVFFTSIENLTGGTVTNSILINLKSAKWGAKQATQ